MATPPRCPVCGYRLIARAWQLRSVAVDGVRYHAVCYVLFAAPSVAAPAAIN